MPENLETKIEAVLFYKNEPISLKKLCSMLEKNEEEVREGLEKLRRNLEGRGLALVETGGNYMLATSGENAKLLDKIAKDELSREIGKAGMETLAIVLYKGGVARRELDYIRGVNSTFILRSLMARGLIERREGEKDARIFHYHPTLALLAHLGLTRLEELPEYDKVRSELGAVQKNEEEKENV